MKFTYVNFTPAFINLIFFFRTMKKSKSKSKRRDRSRSRSDDSKSKRQKPRPKSPSEKDKTKTKTAPRKTRWQADDEKDSTKKVSCHKIKCSLPVHACALCAFSFKYNNIFIFDYHSILYLNNSIFQAESIAIFIESLKWL